MRHSPFTTIYDACVLYPAPLRDLLVRLAGKGLYRARWSAQIDDEWKRNLLLKRRDLTRGQLDRISTLMEAAIPDALVVGQESLYPALNLPDPDDVHVLAAAIRSNAEVIVTFNLKDFPPSALCCFGVEAQHPDEFIMDLWDLDQAAVLEAVAEMRRSLVRMPYTAEALLECYSRQGLPQTAGVLRDFALLI
ncbi:PIN domain-containing protein [Pseudomonas putida]|uniref:PIN domain-containing protein n=1 Tax=Pseudomonas putida TaxID=303 RepID=UPI00125F9B2D|nr:PIN domain-containing protein [Pseudomonas putida]KAB5620792.1 PIN domain-containing protein [Pseudomonas putida]